MKIKTYETNINTQKLKGEKGDGQKWTNISNGRVVYSVFLLYVKGYKHLGYKYK